MRDIVVDANGLADERLTIRIDVRGLPRLRFRFWLATRIIAFALWVCPGNNKVEGV